MTKSPSITEYDKSKYDYSTYWQQAHRQYDHKVEEIALKRMINKIPEENRNLFVDFGGGYGRLMHIYAPAFKHVILLDYSVNNLRNGIKNAKRLGVQNISYIASNLYHLPFLDNSVESGMMIRVLHHIKDINLLFSEYSRVVNGNLIIDCPNKRHFAALFRGFVQGNLDEIRSLKPYNQPPRTDSQDSMGGKQIFLNYHPKHVEKSAAEKGFSRVGRLSVANLRSKSLSTKMPASLLAGIEKPLQYLLAPLLFGPQIWFLFQKQSSNNSPQFENPDKLLLHSLLSCPKCSGKLKFSKSSALCTSCNRTWKLLDSKIWDFRCK